MGGPLLHLLSDGCHFERVEIDQTIAGSTQAFLSIPPELRCDFSQFGYMDAQSIAAQPMLIMLGKDQ